MGSYPVGVNEAGVHQVLTKLEPKFLLKLGAFQLAELVTAQPNPNRMLRALIIESLHLGTSHRIVEIDPDTYCGYGAIEEYFGWYQAILPPAFHTSRAANVPWLAADVLADWCCSVGGPHATDKRVLFVSVTVICDFHAPLISTGVLLLNDTIFPIMEGMSVVELINLVRDNPSPMFLMYEYRNHPEYGGGAHQGRHFEVRV